MRPLSIKLTSVEVKGHVTSSELSGGHRSPPSPWHTPVPYLFGGLAVMLGLIALALLILVYSYWRLTFSGDDSGEGNGGRVEEEEKESRSGAKAANAAYEEKILVIMAGDNLPRFLATPAAMKCVCGDHKGKIVIFKEDGHGGVGGCGGEKGDLIEENEKVEEDE